MLNQSNFLVRAEVWLTIEQKSYRKEKYGGLFANDLAAKSAMKIAKREGLCIIRRIYFDDTVAISRVEYVGGGRTEEIDTNIN